MIVKVGRHDWSVEAVQYDKNRRRVYTEADEKLDYIEYSIVLHFTCPAEAEHCFDHYAYDEDVRIDLQDDDAYTDSRHLENRMKPTQVEGSRITFEREKVMGELAAKALSES